MDPLKYVNWISGPQKVTLGDFADVNIPQGYRLTDVHGAKMVLESFNTPIPDDLVGILAPASGKWLAMLQYSPKGYVKNPDVTKVDTAAVLKQVLEQINEKQGKSSVASLNWQSQPTYDANSHLLEWSLLVGTPSSAQVLNHTAVLLGRHGILQVTVAQPFPATESPSLKELISNITFKDGERYADYQTGDKVAEVGLAELISGEKPAQTAGFLSGGFGAAAAWIYGGLAVCLVAGGVVIVLRRNKTQPRRRVESPVPAVKNETVASGVSSNPPAPVLKKAETNGHAHPKPMPSHANGSKSFNRNRRKRVFDYPKFYTNVMRELSLYSYAPNGATNGKSHSNGHANGYTNGGSNGHSNGHAASSNGATANETIKSQIENLIATQKSLIEEQKCLLEQQTRLIEEKRWLIEEQTAFLKNQSGLAANQ